MSAPFRQDALEIVEERELLSLPRGRDGSELLRLTAVRAKTADGGETSWISLRKFFKAADGGWAPTKAGVTVRARELGPITVALLRAYASRVPSHLHGLVKELVVALETPPNDNAPRTPRESGGERQELPHETYSRLREQRRIK